MSYDSGTYDSLDPLFSSQSKVFLLTKISTHKRYRMISSNTADDLFEIEEIDKGTR